MTSAVLYLRVSTEEQVSNLSLDTQEAETRDLCAKKGWSVAEVFREEGASAKTLERPEIRRLLDYLGKARGKVAYVVVLRVDRLSRNRDDFYLLRHALRRHGVRIVSVREEIADDSISAMIVETFSVLQAQVDNLIRAGRAKTGMSEAARRGRWVWQAPIGYRHARTVDGRAAGLELDLEMAPLVARAFDMVAGGASIDQAFREITAAGLRGRGGRPIGRETFHAIFRRPIYAGRLEVPAWGIDASSGAPAIVDQETFARARRMVDGRKPARRATATLEEFPLRGVARCSCGRKLSAFRARGKTGRTWPYYRCQRCRVQVPARSLEAAFERLLGRLAAPEAAVQFVDRLISAALDRRAAEMEQRLGAARRRLASAEQRLERLLALRIDGEVSSEEYAANRERIVADRDAARLELAELTAPPEVDQVAASAWSRRLLTRPGSVWRELQRERRATFVERVFPSGLVFDAGEFSNPANCLLSLPLRAPGEGSAEVVGHNRPSSNPLSDLLVWRRSLRELEEVISRAA